MQYRAIFEPDGEGILVTFPDLPEAVTGGTNETEATANAIEALELALLNHIDAGEPVPTPTFGEGVPITVPAQTQVKLAFIQAFHASGMTRVALAKRLGKGETEVRRMLNPHHPTRLPTLEAGLRALGKTLDITTMDAA